VYLDDPNFEVTVDHNTVYYWRVDEVIEEDPPTSEPNRLTKGDIWAFRIIEYIGWEEIRILNEKWLDDDCAVANLWCEGADFYDQDGNVNFIDFSLKALYWLGSP
jgi:hypothetical protein